MLRRLDQVLVVDVEATCWDGSPPPGQENEIIQVGVCSLDVATGERGPKRSILVKPVRSRVSPFCTRLTGLTQDQVDHGVPFRRACGILQKDYLSKDRVWASFGDYDRRQFERQCATFDIPYPFGASHLNVKVLFALLLNVPGSFGMVEALERLELPLEGLQHRGDDDAWNIARVLSELISRARTGKPASSAESIATKA